MDRIWLRNFREVRETRSESVRMLHGTHRWWCETVSIHSSQVDNVECVCPMGTEKLKRIEFVRRAEHQEEEEKLFIISLFRIV